MLILGSVHPPPLTPPNHTIYHQYNYKIITNNQNQLHHDRSPSFSRPVFWRARSSSRSWALRRKRGGPRVMFPVTGCDRHAGVAGHAGTAAGTQAYLGGCASLTMRRRSLPETSRGPTAILLGDAGACSKAGVSGVGPEARPASAAAKPDSERGKALGHRYQTPHVRFHSIGSHG